MNVKALLVLLDSIGSDDHLKVGLLDWVVFLPGELDVEDSGAWRRLHGEVFVRFFDVGIPGREGWKRVRRRGGLHCNRLIEVSMTILRRHIVPFRLQLLLMSFVILTKHDLLEVLSRLSKAKQTVLHLVSQLVRNLVKVAIIIGFLSVCSSQLDLHDSRLADWIEPCKRTEL